MKRERTGEGVAGELVGGSTKNRSSPRSSPAPAGLAAVEKRPRSQGRGGAQLPRRRPPARARWAPRGRRTGRWSRAPPSPCRPPTRAPPRRPRRPTPPPPPASGSAARHAGRCRAAGVPPSRAKAKSMREFEVTDDSPQNHMAPSTSHTSARPATPPSSTAMNGLSGRRRRQVADRQRHRQHHRISSHAAHRHRRDDAPGGVARQVDRLLGDMGAGVVAGEGPARLQQPHQGSRRRSPARGGEGGPQERQRLARREQGQRPDEQAARQVVEGPLSAATARTPRG